MGERAQQAADQGAVECRRRPLAADIAEREHGEIPLLEKVVDVAADLASRAQADGDFQSRDGRSLARQQNRLQLAGGL